MIQPPTTGAGTGQVPAPDAQVTPRRVTESTLGSAVAVLCVALIFALIVVAARAVPTHPVGPLLPAALGGLVFGLAGLALGLLGLFGVEAPRPVLVTPSPRAEPPTEPVARPA